MPERRARLALPWRVVSSQAVATLAVALVLFVAAGDQAALSALLGGGVVVVPNALFARTVVRRARVPTPVQARALVLASYTKLVLSLVLMVLVFVRDLAPVPGAFFAALLVAMVLHGAVALLGDRNRLSTANSAPNR